MKKIQDVSRSVEIDASPDLCYRVICDIENYPSWFRHVRELSIRKTGEDGRALSVLYTFDLLIKKGIRIVLNYRYDDNARILHFQSAGGDVSRALGTYEFRELPGDRTLLVFSARVDFGMLMPQTITEFLSGRVLEDFVQMVREECEKRKGFFQGRWRRK